MIIDGEEYDIKKEDLLRLTHPTKPIIKKEYMRVEEYWHCPSCGSVFVYDDGRNYVDIHAYCPDCGQKIDWTGLC